MELVSLWCPCVRELSGAIGSIYLPLNVTTPTILIKFHFPDSHGQPTRKLFFQKMSETNNLYETSKTKSQSNRIAEQFWQNQHVLSQNPCKYLWQHTVTVRLHDRHSQNPKGDSILRESLLHIV